MSLMDMIEQAAGSGAMRQIGARAGISPQQLQDVMGHLAPVLGPKLAEHAATGGLDGVPTGDAAPMPGSAEADEHGRSILGQILGSSRSVAADASAGTGVNVDTIKSLLPQLASIAAVAMASRQGDTGGGLGGMLGGLLGDGSRT